jgi:hypothetical protein
MFERFAADQPVVEALRATPKVRRFLSAPVPEWSVEEALSAGSRASMPGSDLSWYVHAVSGASKAKVCSQVSAAARARQQAHRDECIPDGWWEALPDPPESGEGPTYDFLGAPVGLFFVTSRPLLQECWLELGVAVHAVSMAARAYGLATCLQTTWRPFSDHICQALGVSACNPIAAAMALGYAADICESDALAEPVPLFSISTFHN